MHQMLSTLYVRRMARLAMAALAVGFAGCQDQAEPVPETGTEYYPVAVGNFWMYAVADTTWSEATAPGITSVPTASAYQFKETITEIFTDAAGQAVYRLVRSKLVPPSTTWRDDSVFVLRASARSVVLNRNNAPTLELIFPVQEGRSWNFNAYSNNLNDTITAETRRYSRVGESFTADADGSGGAPAKTYPTTLITTNTGAAAENSLIKRIGYQQVFAKGVGPVYRRRDYFINYSYPEGNMQVYPPDSYSKAFSRRETLIDYGPR